MANHQYDALITSLGAGAFGLVALAAWYWNDESRWRRRLAKLPTTRVGDANEGLAKLVGTVHPIGGTVGAPFSGRPCVGFEVAAKDTGRKNSPQIFAERELVDAGPPSP